MYRRFVAEGVGVGSPWKDLRGQIYLGSENFLRLMGARIEAMGTDMEQVPREMMVPDRPTVEEIIGTVVGKLGVSAEGIFNRGKHQEAFQLMVYLLRRVANLPRKEVASLAGISPSRVSKIQGHLENAQEGLLTSDEIRTLLSRCKATY